MFWTLLALVLMITLGGFISYYGDLQGRRWGKKRVSWFGMRPKHTAILITSLTGGFIALMSIVTVLLAFPTVKEVVLRGERAIEENKRLNISLAVERKMQGAELKKLGEKVHRAQSEYLVNLEKINKELKLRSRELEELRKTEKPKQEAIARLEKKQTEREATLQQLQWNIQQKAKDLAAVTEDNKRATEINNGLTLQIDGKNKQIARLSTSVHDLGQANTELQAAKEHMTSVIASRSKEQAELNRIKSVLLEENKRFMNENNELDFANRERKQALVNKQAELDKVNKQVEKTYSELVEARQEFTQSYHELRQGEINIRAGAELSRRIVPAHLNIEAARKQVIQVLEDASVTAESFYKAERGANNRAVRIVSKRLFTPQQMQDIDESACVLALAENLAASDTPVVVVAHSINNCVQGEQALVELEPFRVKRIFAKNEVVASRLIATRQPLARVKEAIMEFLRNDVRNAAVREGSIPRVNPVTGLKEIGDFDITALNVLADHIKRLGGNVLIKAVAVEPITTADPLDNAHLRIDSVHKEE